MHFHRSDIRGSDQVLFLCRVAEPDNHGDLSLYGPTRCVSSNDLDHRRNTAARPVELPRFPLLIALNTEDGVERDALGHRRAVGSF